MPFVSNNVWWLVCCCLLSMPLSTIGQTYQVQGKVTDAVTNEAIPFTNIFFKGSKTGTTSNFEGKYSITLSQPADSIIASSLGYTAKSKVFKKIPQQVINFQLERNAYNLEAVTITPGENPAVVLMRKVIAHKKTNNKSNLERYSYEAYNKTEIDIYDIGAKFKKNRVLKPLNFIFNYLDSEPGEKPYLPVFLSETLSDEYYRKSPKQQKEIIKANKMSGVENESVAQIMGSAYQDVNIYDNWLGLLTKDFASPIMDNALFYYKFYLVDSAVIDGRWCYKLNFLPKEKAYNTFQGDMWIADTSFAVKAINMQVADHVNINYVDKSSVYQEFKEMLPGTWIIAKDKIVVKFKIFEKSVGFIGRKTTTVRDLKAGTPAMDSIFNNKDEIVLDNKGVQKKDSFWVAHRHEELSKQEVGVYKMVDSLKNNKVFKTYIDIVNAILTGYYPWKYVEFGPYLSTIGLDDVEVFRLRAGMRTTKKLSDRFRVGGYAAYGFHDKRWKYGGDGLVYLVKQPRLELGGGYQHDLDLTGSGKADLAKDNILAGLWRRDVPQKLNFMNQWNVYLEKDWRFGLTARAQFQNRQFNPQFNYGYINLQAGGKGDTVHIFTTTEAMLSFRFAYKEKFITNDFDRISLGTQYPVIEVRYAQGIKNVLGSGFNYQKIDVEISHHFPIHPIGNLYFDVTIGKVFGTAPSQLLAVTPGNETFFFNTYAFNVMNSYEFIADQYVSVILHHHFEGFFLNHIPWVRKLKWREILMFKGFMGTMTNVNKASNQLNGYSVHNDQLNGFTVAFPKPYLEMGIGIENILKIIRVDIAWRLDYIKNPNTVSPPKILPLLGISINL